MARRKKRLVDLVRDGTFLARKDHRLLGERDALPWPALEGFRGAYRAARVDADRRHVALELEHQLREPDAQLRLLGDLQRELRKLGRRRSYAQLERFFPTYLRHQAGPAAGRPFHLDRYQKAFLREFWRRNRHGERVYQVGLLGVPKGNGKTPLAAGLGLHTLVTHTDAPEVYAIAGAKDQADFAHSFARASVEQSALAAWVEAGTRTILCSEHYGEFEILSSDGDLSSGANPSTAIFDELWIARHRQQREAWNSQEKALHKRPGEAFLLGITTAGWDPSSLLGELYTQRMQHPKLEQREDGFLRVVRDTEAGFLFWWYGAPDEADIENPAVIRGANPAPWVRPNDLLRALRRAPDELDWRRLHLNQWTATREAWVSAGAWARLSEPGLEAPVGAEITVGIDAAFNYDTTACSWSWRSPEGRAVQRAFVWSVRPDAPHHELVRDSELVNEDLVEPFVHALGKRYRIRAIAFDPRFFATEARHLAKAGYTVVPIHPSSAPMGDAVASWHKALLAGELAHDGDPVFAKHVAAIASRKTEGGYKIGHLLASAPIDAGIAAILSHHLLPREIEEPVEPWGATW